MRSTRTKASANGAFKKIFNKKTGNIALKALKVCLKGILTIFLIGTITASIAGCVMFAYVITNFDGSEGIPDLKVINQNQSSIIKVLKKNGNPNNDNDFVEEQRVQGANRIWKSFHEIPVDMQNAVIAIEDERFKEHYGVDWKRTVSAFANLIFRFRDNEYGGSTITQQLIKNLTKKDQVTIPRKLQEQWQAMQLEKVLTKKEILTYYLNNVPMGGNFYGIETAAKGYYGKDVRELSLAECASLAGITNWPTKYMPINEKNIEANLARTKMILGLMLEQGKITQSEYDEAINETINFKYNPEAGKVMQTSNQSYFVDEVVKSVKESLMKIYGYTEQAALDIVYNSGLHIYTTMDPNVQKAMDEVFTDPQFFYADNKKSDELPQAAMVVMDKDGYVRGIYGGRGKKEGSVFNRATQARRQPGSAIKPILVYGPGIDSKTITAATVVDDVKQYLLHDKPDTEWPKNVENVNYGLTTTRVGLYKSRNVVATLLLKDYVGVDNALNYLANLGIDRKDEKYLSIAMGGFNNGVTPLELAGAYTAFANKGVYTKPIFFTEVKDHDGNVILENKPERSQVFSEQTAFIMNSMLQDVIKKGTGYPEGIVKYKNADGKIVTIPSAGKTGTTDKNTDKWFAAFTPYYVGVSWYGYDKIVSLDSVEYNNAKKIWNAVMTKIHENLEPAQFFDNTPPNIVTRNICMDSGKIATDLCKSDPRGSRVVSEYFIEGTEPAYSDTCTVHVTARVCTESKDAWGRYLLATENCPESTVKDIVGIKRPVQYTPKFPDDKYPEDYKYEIAEGEYCTVHQAKLAPPVNEDNYDPWEFWRNLIPEAKNFIPGELIPPLNEDIGEPATEGNHDGV